MIFPVRPSSLWAVLLSSCPVMLGGCDMFSGPDVCDRLCLTEIADTYLDAMAERSHADAPLADDFQLVENLRHLPPDKGLWGNITSASASYRILVPDTDKQGIGFIAVVDRLLDGEVRPALLAAYLQTRDGEIVAAEHLVNDVPVEADPDLLKMPRVAFTIPVRKEMHLSHGTLESIALTYYDALANSDGNLAPFAEDCQRQENGSITAAWNLEPAILDSIDANNLPPPLVARDCAGQISSRRFAYIDSIDERRIVAADEKTGLVMGFSHFRQSMTRGAQPLLAADGTEVLWEEMRAPYDLPAAHIFRIAGGEIHEVEAIGVEFPYNTVADR